MANSGEFHEQVKQLGNLIAQFDQLQDGPQKAAGRELVQLLMDVHGAGLERIMEIVFDGAASGPALIDKLAQDNVVGSLLLLYSLHPDDLETRVQKALEQMRPRLRKLACTAELISLNEEAIQIRIISTGHSCGSSSKDLRAIVEEGLFEFAPDVASLEILGLEEPSPAGFVALESLMASSAASPPSPGLFLQSGGAD